jgi:hypothetical protein
LRLRRGQRLQQKGKLTMNIKAVFVNSEKGEITDIVIGNDLQSFYNTIKCDLIECVSLNASHDLVVDEEGALKETPYGFLMPGGQFIYGNAVIVGIDNNNGKFKSVDKKFNADFFKKYIKMLQFA